MFCPTCATQNIDQANYCRRCRAYLSLVYHALVRQLPPSEPVFDQVRPDPLYCPKCAQPNTNTTTECRACGAYIGSIVEAINAEHSQFKEQSSVREILALALFNGKIKLISLLPDGTYKYLDGLQNLHHLIYATSSETLALESAVDELEELMNSPRANEQAFQDFFERNPEFILNDQYKRAHSKVVLTKAEGDTLIPDFVLEPFEQGALCDILELKLPSIQVFVLQKRRARLSAAVLEACAQLRVYSSFFEDETNRNLVRQKYGLLSYKPNMFVIIGRRGKVNPINVRKIEGDLPKLHLYTYDDIVNRMKGRIDAMKRGRFNR